MTDEKKNKIKSIILKVLKIIGRVLFILLVVICWCLSLYRCNRLNQDKEDNITTHEIHKAKINDYDYISYDIGFNVDYQDDNTNKGIYEYYDGVDFWLVTLDTFDYYININQNDNNYNNIYGFGLSYNYEVFYIDNPSITNSSLEDFIENETFYIDNLNINLGDYYNISNCNFIIDINSVNDYLYLDLIIKNDYTTYYESSFPLIDVGSYFDYYSTTYSLNNSYVIPVKQLYYYIYSGDNYFDGFNQGVSFGKDEVLNNLDYYELKTLEQYLNYGQSEYQKGYNENATYSLESQGFLILFNAIMNAPFNILNGILNFELFGVNLFNLFTFIITCGLVIWVIKLFV